MDFIDRIVEQRIAEAIERGDLEPGRLKGKPIADLDRQRPDGWWAEQFVRRERSRLAREEALEEAGTWRVRFWRAATAADLALLVADANRWLDGVNERLTADDTLPRFDAVAVERTWRSVTGAEGSASDEAPRPATERRRGAPAP